VEEFNAFAPERLGVLAFLPKHSPHAAAAELERCAGLGHRGAIVDVFDMDLGDPAWDRLWAAAADTGLPISFHIKGGTSPRLSYRLGKWQSAAFASLLPLQLDEPLATMVFSGALERHPGLRIVLAESGVGWLPYFLARMDLEWRALRDRLDYAPSIAPSELFHRQVTATFEEDALGADVIPLLGADSCMWASDYPHTDSTFPNSRDAIEETLGTLPVEDRRKLTVTNCAGLYGFEVA
jgi:predicted TIM-barrel fold metal-dependent hydrolase